MGPNGLNTLPVCQPNSVHQRDVVQNLTDADVPVKVHLRDTNSEDGK